MKCAYCTNPCIQYMYNRRVQNDKTIIHYCHVKHTCTTVQLLFKGLQSACTCTSHTHTTHNTTHTQKCTHTHTRTHTQTHTRARTHTHTQTHTDTHTDTHTCTHKHTHKHTHTHTYTHTHKHRANLLLLIFPHALGVQVMVGVEKPPSSTMVLESDG